MACHQPITISPYNCRVEFYSYPLLHAHTSKVGTEFPNTATSAYTQRANFTSRFVSRRRLTPARLRTEIEAVHAKGGAVFGTALPYLIYGLSQTPRTCE